MTVPIVLRFLSSRDCSDINQFLYKYFEVSCRESFVVQVHVNTENAHVYFVFAFDRSNTAALTLFFSLYQFECTALSQFSLYTVFPFDKFDFVFPFKSLET